MYQKFPMVGNHFNKTKAVYLDYAATTPTHSLVVSAFKRAVIKYPGNPNSAHALGQEAADEIAKSLKRIRLLLRLPSQYELTPTSGATESNNLALKGIALQYCNLGKTIITTAFEHSSLTASANYFAKQSFNIKIAPTDQWGRVDVNELEKLIDNDTILVSIGSINSEIGIRQPIGAIKEHLVPVELSAEQKSYIYASEADLLNVALFGMRAKQWRDANPDKKGNIRDYASTIELAILSNIEFKNAELIEQKLSQQERLVLLNSEANREKVLFNRNNEKAIYRIGGGK